MAFRTIQTRAYHVNLAVELSPFGLLLAWPNMQHLRGGYSLLKRLDTEPGQVNIIVFEAVTFGSEKHRPWFAARSCRL